MTLLSFLIVLCGSFDGGEETSEVIVGGRLFRETRFSQYFFAHAKGGVNAPLAGGDPVMERSVGVDVDRPGPYAGRSMNCRACHLVNDHADRVRTYTDHARRSPIPAREDGARETPRRSPILVNATLPRSVPLLLHADGEFASIDELVGGTLTGRNFGWLPTERAAAVRHIARVVREDDGSDLFAQKTARLSYAVLFQGTDAKVAPYVRIPAVYRLDVMKATDEEILNAVSRLMGAYVDSLVFGVFAPQQGALYPGSPYDAFLIRNELPLRPGSGESDAAYARRLERLIDGLKRPAWIGPEDWGFKFHRQAYRFGPRELQGLKAFFRNCASCHPPPAFTDFGFHNNGAEQADYDERHGAGAFAALKIPSLEERSAAPDRYLPAMPTRPAGRGLFRGGEADLGVWNIYRNDAVPSPQAALRIVLGDVDLPQTIARFKTPTVRDLGQTGPYFHTGRKDSLADVLRHYREIADLARANRVRNGDERLREIEVGDPDALTAFLQALNEDYND
ncbi:MAG: hypothetical protein JO332_09260 [Planctomycetaceae bacterium]|nr:hypothetical protein [Planctomycetaceae bacterium]